jgi:hypothetical protein
MSDDKTLLPEFLPAPSPAPSLSPRDRVAERARQMLERFRGLGATAGAAVLSLHCTGYQVVDPLPPPPVQCSTSPNPFDALRATARTAPHPIALPNIEVEIAAPSYPIYTGYRLDAVRIDGGTVVNIDRRDAVEYSSSRFVITAVPADATTRQLLVEVDLGCAGATATRRYQIAYQPTPSRPLTLTPVHDTPDAGGQD